MPKLPLNFCDMGFAGLGAPYCAELKPFGSEVPEISGLLELPIVSGVMAVLGYVYMCWGRYSIILPTLGVPVGPLGFEFTLNFGCSALWAFQEPRRGAMEGFPQIGRTYSGRGSP